MHGGITLPLPLRQALHNQPIGACHQFSDNAVRYILIKIHTVPILLVHVPPRLHPFRRTENLLSNQIDYTHTLFTMNIMFLAATRLSATRPKLTSPQQKASFHTAGQLFSNMHEMCISCSKGNHIPPDIQISFMHQRIIFRTVCRNIQKGNTRQRSNAALIIN